MGERDIFLAPRLTAWIQIGAQSSDFTAVGGTVARAVIPTGRKIHHNQTRDQLYAATRARTEALRRAGHQVIEKWECQYEKTNEPCLTKQKKSYLHAIFYDFEPLHDTNRKKNQLHI